MLKKYLAVFLIGIAAMAGAEPLAVYQVVSKAADSQGIYLQAYLDHSIYKLSQDSRLSDLRVVDAQGKLLPYALDKPEVQTLAKVQQTALAFYPIPAGATTQDLQSLNLEKLTLDTQKLELQFARQAAAGSGRENPGFYLVDLTGIAQDIDELQVDWASTSPNQLLQVMVSGSNSLQDWRRINTATLSHLQQAAPSATPETAGLIVDKVPLKLNAKDFRFLRIEFPSAPDGVALTALVATHQANLHQQDFHETWSEVGKLAEDQESALRAASKLNGESVAAWEFQRDDLAAVTRVGVELGQFAYGDKLRLFSRPSANKPWHLLYEGNWFNAQLGDAWQHSGSLSTYANSDSFWRLEMDESSRGQVEPKLEFSRLQDHLKFIANAHPPFRLIVDAQAAGPNQSTSAQILAQLSQGKNIQWQTVELLPLLDKDIQTYRPAAKIPLKTWAFWLALVAAVIVLLWMVLRLFAQMRSAKAQES